MTDWFRLPHLAGIRVTGPDAIAFAHSQFTSSFQDRTKDCWELSARCNSKGRVTEVILGRVHENDVELIVPAEQMADFARALRLYSIGRRLNLSDCPTVAGSLSPPAGSPALALDSGRALSLEQPECQVDEQALSIWRQADLSSGIAWLNPSSSAEFLPQALGLEERGGLSFRKGCYPGQEIVARVHFLGRSKERLSAFRLPGGPADTSDILDRGGQRVGRIICSLDALESSIGLAVISSELEEGADFSCAGRSLSLLEPGSL